MSPSSDTPDTRPAPEPIPPQGDRSGPAAGPEPFVEPSRGVEAPVEGEALAGEAGVTDSDLVDLPDEALTAEERLLDAIVGDPRAAAVSADAEPDEGLPEPGEPSDAQPAEDVGAPAGIAAVEAEPADGMEPPPVEEPRRDEGLETIRQLTDDVESLRRELGRVTADRDDLANRLDLAAVEFDRLTGELDRLEAENGRLRSSAEAADASLKAAQAALAEAQRAAAQALTERDAAAARVQEAATGGQREQERLRKAVQQLESDFELQAQRRRRFIPAVVGVIALLALGAGYMAGRMGRPAAGVVADESPAVPPLPAAATPAPAPEMPAAAAQPVEKAATRPVWPEIRDPRMLTQESSDTLIIRFKQPVYARAAELSPAGRQDLRRLAAILKPNLAAFRVEVEGHTDPSPVSSRSGYADNHELALLRARAAVDVLVREGGLPPAMLSATSAGDSRPPFPGDSLEDRRRCRTVVIKLHRAGAAP